MIDPFLLQKGMNFWVALKNEYVCSKYPLTNCSTLLELKVLKKEELTIESRLSINVE